MPSWRVQAGRWRRRSKATPCGPLSSYAALGPTTGARTPGRTPTTYLVAHTAHMARRTTSQSERSCLTTDLARVPTPRTQQEVPEASPNEWLQLPAVAVFEAFHRGNGQSCSSRKDVRARLLEWVQGWQDGDGSGGWMRAYKRCESGNMRATRNLIHDHVLHLNRMHEVVATWQAPSQIAFIIAGHTSFARLSAITDVIKDAALAGTPFCCIGIHCEANRVVCVVCVIRISTDELGSDEEDEPQFEPIDVQSPSGARTLSPARRHLRPGGCLVSPPQCANS